MINNRRQMPGIWTPIKTSKKSGTGNWPWSNGRGVKSKASGYLSQLLSWYNRAISSTDRNLKSTISTNPQWLDSSTCLRGNLTIFRSWKTRNLTCRGLSVRGALHWDPPITFMQTKQSIKAHVPLQHLVCLALKLRQQSKSRSHKLKGRHSFRNGGDD